MSVDGINQVNHGFHLLVWAREAMALSGWVDYPLNIAGVNWSHKGRNLRFSGEFGAVSWKMPRGFSSDTIHHDLLVVASE